MIVFPLADYTDNARSSRSSSVSPSLSQTSSPGQRAKTRKNFIKNIKPDTFKRPSSYSCTDAEIASAKSSKVVELVGYRKMVATPGGSSKALGNSSFVELGTLSPIQSSTDLKSNPQVPDSHLATSVSMPTLFHRAGWGRNSDGTLPEYREVARRSLRAKKKHAKSSVISVDFGGSDPSLRSEKIETGHNGNRGRLKRAFTDPLRHSENLEPTTNSNDAIVDQTEIRSERSVNRNKDTESDALENMRKKPVTDSDKTTAKKELNFQQELYQNLSKCLTEALGDADDLHDSDKSDDERCVQNGYDDSLERDQNSFGKGDIEESKRLNTNINSIIDRKDEVGEKSGKVSVRSRSATPEKVSISSTPKSGLTVKDILRNSDLKIGQSSGRTDFFRQSTDSNSTANTDSGIDVLSVSGISVKDDQTDTGTIGSKELKSEVKIFCDTDLSSKTLHDRVTVSEFLREEYRKSSLVDLSVVKSEKLGKEETLDSNAESSGLSTVSVRNNFRASSESNLLQSGSLEVKKSSDVMVSSASFPELSKLTEVVKEPPKLVDKVGHSTVRWVYYDVGMKKFKHLA